jgi:hypothetical protein
VNRDPQKTGRCFALKGWHIALAVLIGLGTLIGLYLVVYKNRVEERIGALRAAGYPTTFAELAEYNRLPGGSANAAEMYLRAFAAFVPPVDGANTPFLGGAALPGRGKPLPEPMVNASVQYLASNQRCLALLHDAGAIRDCDYDWDPLMRATITPPWDDLRHCAQLLELRAICSSRAGDANAAVRCIADGLRLAESLRHEPGMIGYLIRAGCISASLQGLERSLSMTSFTDEQLKELNEVLTAAAGTLDFTQALVTERCLMFEECREPSLLGGEAQGPGPWRLPGTMRMGLADTLNYMEDCLAAAMLPNPKRLARFHTAVQRVESLSFVHVMIKMLGPAVGRSAELDARTRAGIDQAKTALAIERSRLATGKLPERLEELVPQYLAQVPIDPFDGQPLRYRLQQPGYLIYSVFEDGQDNGGKEKTDVPSGARYDWCFIVTRQGVRQHRRSDRVPREGGGVFCEPARALDRAEKGGRRDLEVAMRPAEGRQAGDVVWRGVRRQLHFERVEHAVAFDQQIHLRTAGGAPMMKAGPAGQGTGLFENLIDHGGLEQGAQERMSAQGLRRTDLRVVTNQAGVGEVAFGLGGDPFEQIALEGRDLKPLKGAVENSQPAAGSVRRHADLPAQLAVVDLLGGQGGD